MEKPPSPEEQEITILEYLKSLFSSDKNQLSLGEGGLRDGESLEIGPVEEPSEAIGKTSVSLPFPWLMVAAVIFALIAQVLLEPSQNRWALPGILLYFVAIILLMASGKRQEWHLPTASHTTSGWNLFTGKTWLLLPGIALEVLGFFLFSSGSFGFFSTLSWIAGIVLVIWGLWVPGGNTKADKPSIKALILDRSGQGKTWGIVVLLAIMIVLFFRFYHLASLPPELVSAQIDHFYSVDGILQGSRVLSFPQNLVSEPLQYYWSAALLSLFGTEVTFVGIKIAYALAGLASLFYLYRLGSLMFNREIGLIAAVLFGVAFWPNLQTRVELGAGMVLPILVPACFYLLRGLLEERPNDILLSSLLAGLGLMTHKVFLVFPLVALVIMLIWLIGSKPRQKRSTFFSLIGMGVIVTSVTVTPWFRVITQNPLAYFSSILSRISGQEAALSSSPILLFLSNMLSALGITNWSNNNSWVDGIALRPAVDWVTGAFFMIGLVMAIAQYRRTKNWVLLAVLVLYPLFLVPTAMSLAFPQENPSLSRALGAASPVFLIAAIGIYATINAIISRIKLSKPVLKYGLACLVAVPILVTNYQLTFVTYPETYRQNAWNASEMADMINEFENNYGSSSNLWVVGYPYWVDARAVAIQAGHPELDMALQPVQIESTVNLPNPKLFLLNPQDTQTLANLQTLYPTGMFSTFQSENPEKNFNTFIVSQ
ncbi:MAG: glycosyltransferase family 39 protein [Anaerolineaceae bacterium]